MRRTIIASAVLLAGTTTTLGAEPADWSGFYIGPDIGGAWGEHDASVEFNPGRFVDIPVDQDGLVGGLHGGFNFQAGSWVLGVEGLFNWADITGETDVETSNIADGAVVHASAQTNWLASVGGRAGYSFGRTFAFAKAGLAWEDFDFSGQTTINGTPVGGASQDGTRFGWTVGIGLEYALNANWSARLDYDFYDFGDKTYLFGGNTPVTLSPQHQAVRIGITYRPAPR